MPPIPEIQRQRLPSEAVGVPQRDTSIERILGSVSDTASSLAQTEFRSRQLDQQRQSALGVSPEQIRKQTANVAAMKRFVDFDRELLKVHLSGMSFEEKDGEAFRLLDQGIAGVEDPVEQSAFARLASQRIASFHDGLRKQEFENAVIKVKTDIDQSVDTTVKNVAEVFSQPGMDLASGVQVFHDQVETLHAIIANASPLLSPAEVVKYRDEVSQTVARAAVFGLMDSKPEALEAFLASEVDGSGVFTPDQISEIRADMHKAVKAQREAQKMQEQQARVDTQRGLFGQALEGKFPSEMDLFQLEAGGTVDKKFVKSMREWKNTAANRTLTDNPLAVDGLFNAMASVMDPTGKNIDESAGLEKIAAVHQRFVEAMEANTITNEFGQKYLRSLSKALDVRAENWLREGQGWFGGWASRWGALENGAVFMEAKAAFQTRLMFAIDRAEASAEPILEGDRSRTAGSPLSASELNKVVRRVQEDFLFSKDPDVRNLTPGQIYVSKTGRFMKLRGFAPDGEPLVDDDLNAPLLKE